MTVKGSIMSVSDYEETDGELILKLELNFADLSLKRGKVLKSKHQVFDSDVTLTGWKFNEWDYDKPNKVQLPSQARGLFTTEDKIVVRGYNKFFNVNETSTTKWDYILTQTTGPYELTLKENGCIIFISGLSNGQLVVCSKHSTGYRDDVQRNHAEYGFIKVKEQLDALGISHYDLGKALYDMNITAVLELCDDDFEEHVLRYSKKESGLYLHGLNYNTAVFKTYPMSFVHEFADKFGFKKVSYLIENDSSNLKSFLEECAKTGTYQGREVEGFVIRCKLLGSNRDFFFKYKFEEPYLMYRQWREVTKDLISGKSVGEINIKKHKYQTLKYIEFILPLLRQDENLLKEYLASHGVIELRERYLEFAGKKGFEIAADALENNPDVLERKLASLSLGSDVASERKIKYVIVPVATIGCGKTTTALALTHLFPTWTHIQNDNIPSPAKDKLVKGALSLLEDSPCCYIDRNNHQYRERQQIFDDFAKYGNPLTTEYKYICLDFVKDKFKNKDNLWNVTQSRVIERGDNHQSIKLEADGQQKVEQIMRGFIGRYQKVDKTKLPDNLFNVVIDLQINNIDSTLKNIKTIIISLNRLYPDLVPEIPTDDKIQEAFQYALHYKPSFEKIIKDKSRPTKKRKFLPCYIAVQIKDPVVLFSKVEDLLLVSSKDSMKVLYQSFKQLNRLQTEFHVTLTHINSLKKTNDGSVYKNFTNKYFPNEIQQMSNEKCELKELPFIDCSIKLEKLCMSRDLICIQVSISLNVQNQDESDVICANKFPHITLGTIDISVMPFESNTLLKHINDDHYGEDRGFFELEWQDEVILTADQLSLYAHR